MLSRMIFFSATSTSKSTGQPKCSSSSASTRASRLAASASCWYCRRSTKYASNACLFSCSSVSSSSASRSPSWESTLLAYSARCIWSSIQRLFARICRKTCTQRPSIMPTTLITVDTSRQAILPSALAAISAAAPAATAATTVTMRLISVMLFTLTSLSGNTISTSAMGMSWKRLMCRLRCALGGVPPAAAPGCSAGGLLDAGALSRYTMTTSLKQGSTSSTSLPRPATRERSVGNSRRSVLRSTVLAARWLPSPMADSADAGVPADAPLRRPVSAAVSAASGSRTAIPISMSTFSAKKKPRSFTTSRPRWKMRMWSLMSGSCCRMSGRCAQNLLSRSPSTLLHFTVTGRVNMNASACAMSHMCASSRR
mmetsp:Transcript_35834/g.90070  ORF Transcript_35834/g.90070 Transcript_35834/m.90070 type:complete len:369 (+) Transcript_35834:200-1306(+)